MLSPDQEHVKAMICDTVTMLCRRNFKFVEHCRIDALIGVTLDEQQVFLISMNELINNNGSVGNSHLQPNLANKQIPGAAKIMNSVSQQVSLDNDSAKLSLECKYACDKNNTCGLHQSASAVEHRRQSSESVSTAAVSSVRKRRVSGVESSDSSASGDIDSSFKSSRKVENESYCLDVAAQSTSHQFEGDSAHLTANNLLDQDSEIDKHSCEHGSSSAVPNVMISNALASCELQGINKDSLNEDDDVILIKAEPETGDSELQLTNNADSLNGLPYRPSNEFGKYPNAAAMPHVSSYFGRDNNPRHQVAGLSQSLDQRVKPSNQSIGIEYTSTSMLDTTNSNGRAAEDGFDIQGIDDFYGLDRSLQFRRRSVFNPMQKARLKWAFAQSHYVTREMVSALSEELQLSEPVIRVWFQNQRMKVKRIYNYSR